MVEGDADEVAAIHYYYARQGRFSDRLPWIEGAVTAHELGLFYRQTLENPAAPLSMRVAVGHGLNGDGQEIARVVGFYAILRHIEIEAQELLLLAVLSHLPERWRVWRNISVGKRLFINMLAHSKNLGGRRGLLVARTNTQLEVPVEALALLKRAGFHNIGVARNLAVHIRPSSNGWRECIRSYFARNLLLRYFR